MNKRVELTIHGQVQAVSFRLTARKWAQDLGLTGFACNNPDGTLTIIVQGDEKQLEDFISRCYDGPKWADVADVKIQWHEKNDSDLTSFEIRPT